MFDFGLPIFKFELCMLEFGPTVYCLLPFFVVVKTWITTSISSEAFEKRRES